MRSLYYVPIVHTSEESGPSRERVKVYLKKRWGEEAISQTEEIITYYWQVAAQEIENEKEKGNLEPSNLSIYVDSLPVGMEEKFAKSGMEKKIPYWLIIKKLTDKGAKLVGTEDPKLYFAESQEFIQAMGKMDLDSLYLKRVTLQDLKKIESTELTQQRDKFIAKRIDETLLENGIGILFMGAGHKVIEELDKLEEAGKLSSPMKVIYL